MERSHRTDDEEFYRPYLSHIHTPEELLAAATQWVYFYNVVRPHFGVDMEGKPPLQALRQLGYHGPDQIALFPPILLDVISPAFVLACHPEGGNNLLAHYRWLGVRRCTCARPAARTRYPTRRGPYKAWP
ncbi:MAG: hypothetical protein H5T59_00960 [Anaerolineae bacterium]|nr:hypothetical protein [Anaerolineae bacterium]